MFVVMQDVDSAVRPSLVIARYKGLWLQLSRLVRQIGVAMCYTYGFYVLYLFLMFTVSIYGVFSTLAVGLKLRLVYLVGDSLITGIQLFVVCDGASSVSREVSGSLGTAVPALAPDDMCREHWCKDDRGGGDTGSLGTAAPAPAPDDRCLWSIGGKMIGVG
jgi:hypothetical protein